MHLFIIGDTPGKRTLVSTAVPHIFPHHKGKKQKSGPTEREKRASEKAKKEEEREKASLEAWADAVREGTLETHGHNNDEISFDCSTSRETQTDSILHNSVTVQTDFTSEKQIYSAKRLSNDMLHFYTGLESYGKFVMVLNTLGPAAHNLNYYYGGSVNVSVEDQFLITLMKLRRHTPHQELCFWFGLNDKQVTNVYVTWVNFMYHQWGEIDWWPVKELVHFYAPSDFKAKFPNTRVIVDGMECPIKKPNKPVAQQATF